MGEAEGVHELTAKRTLVKSPPELWSELSEIERLARHLEAFGQIKITKLEPEHTVAWEGEAASGTVVIEPSGWGTRVTLNAQVEAAKLQSEPAQEPEPAPRPSPAQRREPQAARRTGFFARLFGWGPSDERLAARPQPEPVAERQPEPVAGRQPEPAADVQPECVPTSDQAQAILEEALEALGSAHHRPFSRG